MIKTCMPLHLFKSYSYFHFLSGNHLASTRQFAGQTVQSEAMATDAVHADVNYRLTVSCSSWILALCLYMYLCVVCVYMCVCVCTCVCVVCVQVCVVCIVCVMCVCVCVCVCVLCVCVCVCVCVCGWVGGWVGVSVCQRESGCAGLKLS